MTLKAVLLDLDGTLADSLPVMRLAYARFLESCGRPNSDDEFQSLNGPPLAEVVRRLKVTHRLEEPPERLLVRYHTLIDELYAATPPRPGARELLSWTRQQGMMTGVVTSNDSRRTWDWLRGVDLAELIGVVVGGEMVARGKPDPEPYRMALKLMQRDAADAVAVEDSPQGAVSAVTAGLRCFALLDVERLPAAWPTAVMPVRCLHTVLCRLRDGRT